MFLLHALGHNREWDFLPGSLVLGRLPAHPQVARGAGYKCSPQAAQFGYLPEAVL